MMKSHLLKLLLRSGELFDVEIDKQAAYEIAGVHEGHRVSQIDY